MGPGGARSLREWMMSDTSRLPFPLRRANAEGRCSGDEGAGS